MNEWIFTFGYGQEHEGYYVRVFADTYGEARDKMIQKYGLAWAFQYSIEEWTEWEKRRPAYFIEKELEVIK